MPWTSEATTRGHVPFALLPFRACLCSIFYACPRHPFSVQAIHLDLLRHLIFSWLLHTEDLVVVLVVLGVLVNDLTDRESALAHAGFAHTHKIMP